MRKGIHSKVDETQDFLYLGHSNWTVQRERYFKNKWRGRVLRIFMKFLWPFSLTKNFRGRCQVSPVKLCFPIPYAAHCYQMVFDEVTV